MITLNDKWILLGNWGDTDLGYAGENEVRIMHIQMPEVLYNDWSIVIDVKYDNTKKNIWATEKSIDNGKLILSTVIRKEYIPKEGNIHIQVRASSSDGRVKKSSLLTLNIKDSINAPDMVPLPLPSEFYEYEQNVISAKSAAEIAASRAGLSEQSAENSVAECERILEEVKDNNTWREYGQTPCKFNLSLFGEVKLKSEGECSYCIYSDTVKDMASQERNYYGSITEDTSRGYYEFTLGSKATAWYNVYFKMTFSKLEIGKAYKIYVDTTGLQPGSTTATMMYGQFLLAELINGQKGNQIMAPTRISSAGLHGFEFVPTTADIILEYYPGNVLAELVAGYQFRFRDLYVNRSGSGDEHTPIYEKRGIFNGETIIQDAVSGLNLESVPVCTVWYSKAQSNVYTVNGIRPDDTGNVLLQKPPLSRLEGKILACFGDSITGNFQPPVDYPSVIAKLTGMQVYNFGVGGCRMSQHPDQYYDAFSMYRLADAVTTGNFALQEAAVGHTANYAADRVTSLKSIDWTKVDYVTILFGTNDIQGGVSLDIVNDPKDVTTYLGAARYSLEALWNRYPNLRVLLLTPIYRYWDNERIDSDEKMFGNRHFYEFGNALLQLAKDYKTPALDLYYTLGINKYNRGQYFSTGDGTHPNDAGRVLLGEKVAWKLLSEF
ncbi:SGNH/GDSL hydrolase family protein [Anaeromassilibacillus senegalensis]|uniref:SGNH/GDSL hydrolase family protein n=1 Tax=Anaeromassilibacillus senegalensis TaxID=1673717 RepID=UPI0006829366|nr:SGNH/GDSL hydrolase family protein [Anaeromassilibacillus senegalensis]